MYLSDDIYLTSNWKNFLLDFESGNLDVFEWGNRNWNISKLPEDWLHIGNCPNPGHKTPRSSTGIFTYELISKISRFDMDYPRNITLLRNGKDDNQWNHMDVDDWNNVQSNFQYWLEQRQLDTKSFRLSNTYRTSKYMIEAERGLISNKRINGAHYEQAVNKII
jgi:hypothetical protein